MRHAMAIVLALVVAISAFADERYEQYGEWTVTESEGTLLDEGFSMAIAFGLNDGALGLRYAPTIRVAVVFPDYLGTTNEDHNETVIFVTDQIDAINLDDTGYRVDVDMVVWEGKQAQRMVDEILRAGAVMLRTYDYNGQSVDAIFEYNPANAAMAWEAVK